MTPEIFRILFNETVNDLDTLLNKKSAEYATPEDKLHNFKVGCDCLAKTPEAALWGMMKKHHISLTDMVYEIEHGEQPRSLDVWREKVHDEINYLILLKALVVERYGSQNYMEPKVIHPVETAPFCANAQVDDDVAHTCVAGFWSYLQSEHKWLSSCLICKVPMTMTDAERMAKVKGRA